MVRLMGVRRLLRNAGLYRMFMSCRAISQYVIRSSYAVRKQHMNDRMLFSDGRRTEGIMRKSGPNLTAIPLRIIETKNGVTRRKVCYMLYANNKRLSF